jgi:hypothetical protein
MPVIDPPTVAASLPVIGQYGLSQADLNPCWPISEETSTVRLQLGQKSSSGALEGGLDGIGALNK